jgi:hypothetical protein
MTGGPFLPGAAATLECGKIIIPYQAFIVILINTYKPQPGFWVIKAGYVKEKEPGTSIFRNR